jgi:hypothetical protein
VNSFNASFI